MAASRFNMPALARFWAVCLLVSLGWPGAGQAAQAAYQVADVNRITGIGKLTILPVVAVADLPEARKQQLMDDVRRKLALELALKGYVLKRVNRFSPHRDLTPKQVAAMDHDQLATLGPDDSRYIVICFLNALETSTLVIADSAQARIAAILIDKQTSEVLWRNESDRTATLSWLNVGLLVTWLADEDSLAIYEAFRALFEPFPEKPMD